MKIEIAYDETELKMLILKDICDKMGTILIKMEDIKIEVKSKQNYKSEWEEAEFRARYTRHQVRRPDGTVI